MYYQSGSMRQFNNEFSPGKNSNAWQRQNEFQYAQRSKYEKSEISYGQQKSRIIYEQQKTDRYQKLGQNKQFTKIVPIKIRSTDFQDKMQTLRIQLINVCEKNNNSITMYMTDDTQSLFLWSFVIRDHEYSTLKNQQSLKVDFHGFPDLINQFLGLCVDINKQTLQSNKANLFYAVFEMAKGNQLAQLKIIQANKYKQSCHLSLKYKKANDEQVKKFLGQKFDKEKQQNQRLNNKLLDAQHQLNRRVEEIQKLSAEYRRVKKQLQDQIQSLQKSQKTKVSHQKSKVEQQYIQKIKNQQQKSTQKYKQMTNKIQQLQEKLQKVKKDYQQTNKQKINLQSSQSLLKTQKSINEQKYAMLEKNYAQLKIKQEKFNSDYHTLKNQNIKLTYNITNLEDRLKQKQQRISQNIQVKSTNITQIAALQENLRVQKKKVQKLQQKNQSLQNQIAKMHKKYEKKKDRFNQYEKILTIQEQKIKQYESVIQQNNNQSKKMLEEIVQFKNRLQASELEIKDRDMKIKDFKVMLQRNQQHMENQTKIISELNKRLNQKAIGSTKVYNLAPLQTYTDRTLTGFGSTTSMIGRQFSTSITSSETTRTKYSPSPISTSPLNQKLTDKVIPAFKKYNRDNVENDRYQQNSYNSESRSRSPIANRLNQQLDPQESDKTKQKIGPVKFKK